MLDFQVNLRLILVSGKTKEYLFNPTESAGEIAQYVFDHWPEGESLLHTGELAGSRLGPISLSRAGPIHHVWEEQGWVMLSPLTPCQVSARFDVRDVFQTPVSEEASVMIIDASETNSQGYSLACVEDNENPRGFTQKLMQCILWNSLKERAQAFLCSRFSVTFKRKGVLKKEGVTTR